MRSDMDRVIITPPRYGGDSSRRGRKVRGGWDNLPIKQGMKKPHHNGWGTKYQSDFLNPLYGFLRKNVGRPWNDVWSDVCQFSSRGYVTNHVRFHTAEAVDHLVLKDGKLWLVGHGGYSSGKWTRFESKSRWETFYIDLLGILCTTQRVREASKPKRMTKFELDDGSELRLLDGLWFQIVEREVELGPGPVSRWTGRRDPPITYMETVSKQALGKRDLKYWGLQNHTIQYRRARR